MSDLIRRQDAIDALENHTCYGIEELDNLCNASVADSEGWLGGIRDALRAIENVPSAEPERKWIPVTERLPKTNGCYLIWRPHFFGGEIGMPAICYFDGQNTWYDAYGVDFSRVLYKKDITAWMPLPEPYGGE